MRASREEFFSIVYGPTVHPSLARQLGNLNDADGGRFYGRGFIQITGRANYQRFAVPAGCPIDNPDMLDTDLNLCARTAMAYMRGKCPADPTQKTYVDAGIRACGNNIASVLQAKHRYVDFFIKNGTGVP